MGQKMMGFLEAVASFQTDNHTNTSLLSFYRPDALTTPNQQCQSTEGKIVKETKNKNRYA